MKFATIVAAADFESLAETQSVSLHLGGEERGAYALEVLFDLFGDDQSVASVGVVIDGKSIGTLRREALYGLVADRMMKIGEGPLSSLPGDEAPAYRRLRCPTLGCTRRAICAPDLNSDVLNCVRHNCAMVIDEDR